MMKIADIAYEIIAKHSTAPPPCTKSAMCEIDLISRFTMLLNENNLTKISFVDEKSVIN